MKDSKLHKINLEQGEENMKDFLNQLSQKASEVAGEIGKKTEPIVKKTEEVVELQKIKNKIRTLENYNDESLMDLGELIYNKYIAGEELEAEQQAICEEIEQRNDEIWAQERLAGHIKGIKFCSACEREIDKNSRFCSYCGTKFEEPKTEESVSETLFEEGDVVEIMKTNDPDIEIELVVKPESKLQATTKEVVNEVKDVATEAAHDTSNFVKEVAHDTKEFASDVAHNTKDFIDAQANKIKDVE